MKLRLHMAKPKDFRPQLLSMSRYFAKEEAKDQIRAKGHKVTQYAARDISALADQLLLSEPERFVAQARRTLAAEIERKLLRTFAQNSQHLSNPQGAA
jgi:hypothetical protein